jgi:hypothetical protein
VLNVSEWVVCARVCLQLCSYVQAVYAGTGAYTVLGIVQQAVHAVRRNVGPAAAVSVEVCAGCCGELS